MSILRVLSVLVSVAAIMAGQAGQGSLGAEVPLSEASPDGLPLRLVLAVDGIPYELFAEVQSQGRFAGFHPVRRMVSTFPSLSDVAFSTIAGGEPPEGYQVMRFDRDLNRITGTTLFSLSSQAHRHLPVDTRARSSGHRMVSYVFSFRTSLQELRNLRRDFLRSRKPTFVGYIEATDAVLHVHGRGKAMEFLVELDRVLADLEDEVRRRTARDLAVDIVSDHGSTLRRGRPARTQKTLESCGFRRRRRLESPHDVAYARAGIIGAVAISCDPSRAEEVARCALDDPAVDIAAFARDGEVVVMTDRGTANIRLLPGHRERYAYRMVDGDPLAMLPVLGRAAENGVIEADEDSLFQQTVMHVYPDPLRRLWEAFHGVVRTPPEVLLSLRDGYESGHGFVRAMATLRGRHGTHGSLTRVASLGMLVSNWRKLGDTNAWRAREQLFGDQVAADARSAVLGSEEYEHSRRSRGRIEPPRVGSGDDAPCPPLPSKHPAHGRSARGVGPASVNTSASVHRH